MKYLSTRDKTLRLASAEAIKMGLSRDGGLFTPEQFPSLTEDNLTKLCSMTYPQRAAYVMELFLDDFSRDELLQYAEEAYADSRFDSTATAPLRTIDGRTWCLELWHGPTSAFKDMALQMLPRLLSASLKKTGETRTACILAATSGDTGKAAMEGFADVPQTKILVFYPENGVSEIQKLQMVTQQGDNVAVCAVKGNFDDAQNGVKRIFSDAGLRKTLDERGYFLSSANSINWGRILPQLVYYISAYCDLLSSGAIRMGDRVNYCVPTGNFGNILACYYAKKMGLPVGKLICASNRNDVLTDFIRTGVYDRSRPFYTTTSPSMDILISSNLERLLFDLSDGDDEAVRGFMTALSREGRYEISSEMKSALQEAFYGGCCSEEATSSAIAAMYDRGYLIDTHTAVAVKVLEDYRRDTGDDRPAVFVSTASPYKFCGSVLSAIGETAATDSIAQLDQLHTVSGTEIPARLSALRTAHPRFSQVTAREEMETVVLNFLQ